MTIIRTTLPRWATDDVIDGTSGLNNVIEPSEGKKDQGWNYLEKPARQYFNWLGRQTNQWLQYIDDSINTFAPYETNPATMAISLNAGRVNQGTDVLVVAAQNTGVMTAPITNPRIDRIVISETTGIASIIAGSEAASPTAPAFTINQIPIAQILLYVGMTEIVNADITDERSNAPITESAADYLFLTKPDSSGIGVYSQNSTTGATATDGFLVGIDADEKALLWNYENTDILFATNNIFRGKIDNGGNWLISPDGTDIEPANNLVLYDNASLETHLQFCNLTTGVLATDGFIVGIDSNENAIVWNYENTDIIFGANNAEVMKAGLSANGAEVLSVGKSTIENWNGAFSVFQLGGNSALWADQTEGANKGLYLTQNIYFDGSLKYVSTDEASYAYQNAGKHVFYSAQSGIIDTAISFIEVMKAGLSASGAEVLSIGKSTIENWGPDFSVTQLGGNSAMMAHQVEGAGKGLYIFQNAYNDGAAYKYISTDEATLAQQTNGNHVLYSAASGTAETAIIWTEVMKAGLSANGAEVLSIGKSAIENWGAVHTGLQVGGNYALWSTQAEGAGATGFTSQNVYFNGSAFIYISTDEASYASQVGGTHQWFSAASGTLDTAIVFTEVMRTGLSANGAEVLSIGKSTIENWNASYSALQLGGNSTLMGVEAEGADSLLFSSNNGVFDGSGWKYISTDEATSYYQGNGGHVWRAAASGTADTVITWTEVMKADLTGLTVNGVRNTRTVILDTPVKIIGTLTETAAWTTLNNAALNAAGAKTAILRCSVLSTSASAATTDAQESQIFLRKTGSALAAGESTRVVSGSALCSVVGQFTKATNYSDTHVNLDGNFDFDYFTNESGAGTTSFTIYLIGYIVNT